MAAQLVDGFLKPDAHVLVVSPDRFAELWRDDEDEQVPSALLRLLSHG